MSRHSLPLRDALPHVSSPLRRKSMLNRSGSNSSTLVQNDDDAERRELRRNAELEMLQREVTPSTSEKRRSIGSSIAELSAAQLAEHYANCIKLSAENKINAKNAFSLQLIDYMAMMLKRRDSKMDNFQVASCTLDASTKIYAYRVDCVHTDVLKMAGGLAAGARKKQADQDEDEGIGEEPAEGTETIRPKRRARKAKSTVAANVESINGKLDLNHDMDPFFLHSAGSLGDCQPGDCHFLAGLKICSNYSLALDSCLPYWCLGSRSEFADVKISLPGIPDLKNKTFCPAFEDFTFSNWSLEKEADTMTPPAAAGLPPVDDDYVFDVNAEPEPIPEPEPTDVEPEHFEIAGVDDYQDSEDEEEVAPACQVKHRRPAAIVDLRKHLSLTPREYSYFRAGALDLWAGPSHWKPKPYRDRGTSTEEQNKDGSAATAIAKQKKQKKYLVLEFNDLEAVLGKAEKSSLNVRLARQTLKKWSGERISNPLDMFYDLSRFTQLEFLKHVAVRLPTEDQDDDSVVDAPAYNYDNDNDAEEYCPNVVGDDDDDDYCEEPVGPDGVPLPVQLQDVHNATTQLAPLDEFAGDNLVAPPTKVSRVFIPYAMQAKKMDMKKLKHCIWNLLTESDAVEGPLEDDLRVEKPKKLSSIYSQLPSKLSAKMAENLSPHLAICALLHLANEKNLCIVDQEDLSDLTISQF